MNPALVENKDSGTATRDIGHSIKFRDICAMLSKIEKAKLSRKDIVIRRYYESFCKHRDSFRRSSDISDNTEEDGYSSFYNVLRILLPNADTARDAYGLQITALGRLYIKVLQLPSDSREAIRLKWRTQSVVHCDYGDIVYSVLAPRCPHRPSDLSLAQIHSILDNIASGDTAKKEFEVIRFTEMASAAEQKWFIRLLLKRMNIGIGEHRIFGILHPRAHDIYQRCASLQRVCKLLADNTISDINEVNHKELKLDLNALVEPFQHIRPMLCERFPGKIDELMQTDVLYMETKMDGERFQLHFANGRFKFISRNGVDYTYSFGSSFDDGTYTSQLEELWPSTLQSIIVDGEMMVWDEDQKRYRDKAENTDVKHLKPERNWRPCFVAYDLLYLNGNSMLDMIYTQRTYKLQTCLKEKLGVLQIMKAQKIPSLCDFNRMFQEILDANAEGIVLKQQQSTYKPGQRIGGGWYKDKADYIKGLTTEFDLLIIGGFYNRTRSYIMSFLVGVLKLSDQHDEVYSVGKVTNSKNGHTLNNTLKPYWHDTILEPPPLWYKYKKGSAEGRPDVWIEPRHSTILQVKAADLAPNSAFFMKSSLHFPRTEAWRNDKVWHECLTFEEYVQFCRGKSGVQKINKRALSTLDFTVARKRQKLTTAGKRKLGVLAYEKRFDASTVPTTSRLFERHSFCILSGAPRRHFLKQDLQNLVAQHGGEIVLNPTNNDNQFCIVGDITYYVERILKQQPQRYNIVRLDWLLRACDQQSMNMRPNDMLCMTPDLRREFSRNYDKMGDSYRDDITSIREMTNLLNDISKEELQTAAVDISEFDLMMLERRLLKEVNWNFFRDHLACFYVTDPTPWWELRKLLFKQHGGQYLDDLDDCGSKVKRILYIFIYLTNFDKDNFKIWSQNHFSKSQLKKIKVVNVDWIQHSHDSNCRLDIDEYAWVAPN